jgi:hypothetical protein
MPDGTRLASEPRVSTGWFQAPREAGPLSAVARAGFGTQLLAQLVLSAVTLTAVYFIGPGLGFVLTPRHAILFAMGAVAVELAPRRAYEIAAGLGALLLAWYRPIHGVYYVSLVLALYLVRRRGWALAAVVATLAIAVPKTLFSRFYHQPYLYDWINEPSLAVAIFITIVWWRETRSGRAPEISASQPTRWALLFFFPTHAVNPLVLGPTDVWRTRQVDAGAVLQGIALVAAKAAIFAALADLFPGHGFANIPGATLMSLSSPALWRVVLLNYFDLMLVLSGTADIAVLLARLYGWNLPSPFRLAALAWNPVELWRRWGIYNRRFLLKAIYFPLGGSRGAGKDAPPSEGNPRHLLNVMLTFLGSALVLHSGWFGSKYWAVGVPGWRDQSIYFLLQGVAVCACLVYWRMIGKPTGADRRLRWSPSRLVATVATQAFSAVVHIIVLVQAVPLGDRWRLIARCLGL